MILFIADLHIKLGQRNVPVEWSRNRYDLLFKEIKNIVKKNNVSTVIHGGDIFDRVPSLEELGIFFSMLDILKDTRNILYSGNHEATGKHKTFLSNLKQAVKPFNAEIVDYFLETKDYSILPYNELKTKDWHNSAGKVLFTHVRAEVPPHVQPEVDLNLFDPWEIVYAGDLHAHSNSQRNIVYPGSPVTTSFHRSRQDKENGVLLIEGTKWKHVDLSHLPQLIRKTTDDPEEMVPTDFDHTIYELVGNLEELSKVTNIELLDKKVTKRTQINSLDLNGSIEDELIEYLIEVLGVDDPESIMAEYHDSIATANMG